MFLLIHQFFKAYDERQIPPTNTSTDGRTSLPSTPPTPALPPSQSRSLLDSFRQKLRGHPMVPPTMHAAEQDYRHLHPESRPLIGDRPSQPDTDRKEDTAMGVRPDQDGKPCLLSGNCSPLIFSLVCMIQSHPKPTSVPMLYVPSQPPALIAPAILRVR